MSDRPLISINIVVLNGAKYARFCFDSILEQTYPHELIEVNVLDNGSTDETQKIIEEQGRVLMESGFSKFELIKSDKNLGMWPGQEELLKTSAGKYIVAAAIDIMYERDFISNSVEILEENPKVGALQSKTYTFNIENNQVTQTKIIDTCGFEIQRSRRIVNIGHGQLDEGQFSQQQQIFAVEGACPVLRRQAIDAIRIDEQFIDPEYFWYGDDLDFAWRMTIFGWHQLFAPSVIAFHDRQTTKATRTSWRDFIALRRVIPIKKRQLDWKNVRFTIIRNDYIMNILKDLPYILRREVSLLAYLATYEFPVFLEIFNLLKRLPRLLRQRRKIMSRAAISAKEFRKFIH